MLIVFYYSLFKFFFSVIYKSILNYFILHTCTLHLRLFGLEVSG